MQSFPVDVLVDIRHHLEEEKDRVTARIKELELQDPFSNPDRLTDNAASDAEANEESSHDRYSALVEQLKGQLSSISASLARVTKGTYGFCSICHKMIDTDRLSIIPTATLCTNCERKKKSE